MLINEYLKSKFSPEGAVLMDVPWKGWIVTFYERVVVMRILLVEDDESLGDGLRAGLQLHGHVVDWVKDGGKAKTLIVHPTHLRRV